MFRIQQSICLILLFRLIECSQKGAVQKILSSEDRAEAMRYFNLLRLGDFDRIEEGMDQRLKGPMLRSQLERMEMIMPTQEPNSVTVVGAQNKYINGSIDVVSTTLELNFSGKWFLYEIAFQRRNGVEKS